MTETGNQRTLSDRLQKLPGQLLLALVNATAVLVIVAGIVVIIALNAVNQATARLAGSARAFVAAEMKLDPQQLLASVDQLKAEIRDYRAASTAERSERADRLEAQMTALNNAASQLNDTLRDASVRLTDEAVRTTIDALADSILRLRNCQPEQS